MKHIGHELFSFIDKKNLVKRVIAEEVGITPANLSNALRRRSMDCELFERVCNAIGFNPMDVFEIEIDNDINKNDNDNHERITPYTIPAGQEKVAAEDTSVDYQTKSDRDILLSIIENQNEIIKLLVYNRNMDRNNRASNASF